jgi:hypothetical protein
MPSFKYDHDGLIGDTDEAIINSDGEEVPRDIHDVYRISKTGGKTRRNVEDADRTIAEAGPMSVHAACDEGGAERSTNEDAKSKNIMLVEPVPEPDVASGLSNSTVDTIWTTPDSVDNHKEQTPTELAVNVRTVKARRERVDEEQVLKKCVRNCWRWFKEWWS